jgi:hypothetical protein
LEDRKMQPQKKLTLEELEQTVPKAAKKAVKKAFKRALASGTPVLISDKGTLQVVGGNGSLTVMKQVEPRIPMIKNKVIVIPD